MNKQSTSAAAIAASKDKEEAFLTLLQRIQRHYHPPNNDPKQSNLNIVMERPPDEAATALGRQVALTLHSMEYIPKGIQEKALAGLVNKHVNPSVILSFFDTLLQKHYQQLLQIQIRSNNTSDDSSKASLADPVNMDWLPYWILHTETAEDIPNYEALTAMIRAYARYKAQQCIVTTKTTKAAAAAVASTGVANTFRRLQTPGARIAMLREFTKVAFQPSAHFQQTQQQQGQGQELIIRPLLSPLLSAAILTLPATESHEALLFLQDIWRWAAVITSKRRHNNKNVFTNGNANMSEETIMDMLMWMTTALDLFLWGVPCHQGEEKGNHILQQQQHQAVMIACKEMAHRWFLRLVELGSTLVTEQAQQQHQQFQMPGNIKFHGWIMHIVSKTLPRLFAIVPSYRIPMDSILLTIRYQLLGGNHGQIFSLDAAGTLRLASLVLSSPIREDTNELLGILLASVGGDTKNQQQPKIVTAILKGLASIYHRDEICGATSKEFIQSLNRSRKKNYTISSGGDLTVRSSSSFLSHRVPVINLIQFLDETIADVDSIVSFLSREDLLQQSNLTAVQQVGALLIGIALLDESNHYVAYPYLKNLLTQYPHLGIPLLPVVVDSINAACIRGDGTATLQQLEFLCDVVVQDTQCAREVWNLVGIELMKPTTPSVIRASLIRLFPKICQTNKRLYKRVIEALGNTLANHNEGNNESVEIRLAIIATIADLAREDRIRDVTDVIGWIQNFIEDGGWNRPGTTLDKQNSAANATLVHFAVLSLHYLVLAQELDYNLVLVVLSKRLCDIHDMEEMAKLPVLVVESLTLLLGDGECEEVSEDDDEPQPRAVGVPPHVSKSVETLLNLALSEKLNPSLAVSEADDGIRKGALLRCRRNVYESLSRYSIEGLGIDDDGVKDVCSAYNASVDPPPKISSSGIRYSSIKAIIEEGIDLVVNDSTNNDATHHAAATGIEVGIRGYSEDTVADADVSDTLAKLISKIILFEEQVIGSALWQKRGSISKTPRKKQVSQFHVPMDNSVAKALPSPTSVQQLYNQNRNTATSLAALLCFEGKPLSLYADLAGDIANESSDPLIRAFTVQASLNGARSILRQLVLTMSNSEGFEQILLEIRDWRFRLDNSDNMFLALSSLALYIPDVLGPYGDHSSYVEEICEDVWFAYNNHEFEKNDIGKLSLGFVGVCAVRSRNLELLGKIVSALENSVTSYGGQASFGAYYALAIIAQSCPELQTGQEGEKVDDRRFTSRIVGFLTGELVSCIRGQQDALDSLVECIKDETISPEVIDLLTTLNNKTMTLMPTKKKNAKSLFISLAICLPALAFVNDELLLGVYCLLEGLPWGSGKGIALPSVLLACRNSGLFESKEIERIYAKYASVFEEGMDKGVDGLDDIFYAVTATVTKTIPITIRRFLVGNRTLFNEDGRANSLLAAAVSLSSVPCLGCGALRFTDPPQLSPRASVEDVKGVVTLMSEAAASKELNIYSEIAILLTGFMASIKIGVETGTDASTRSMSLRPKSESSSDQHKSTNLPTAQEGTVLDVLMRTLILQFDKPNLDATQETNQGLVKLIGCLGVLSLPGHFASFLDQMLRGSDRMKCECIKLLVSQIRGRPRAVFDGKEYINLALELSKMPIANLRSLLGHGDATRIFIESFAEIIPRMPSGAVEEAVENVWRLCINQVAQIPAWTMAYLSSMKTLLKCAAEQKSFSVSPKTLNAVRIFLLKRGFAGIRDAPWTTTTSSKNDEKSIIEVYVNCLMEMPITSLIEAEFFALKDLDGFIGEALRNRCVMILVRQGYFTTPSRASSEIASALAWFSRQLVSAEDEIFSSTLLQVSCAIAEATSKENSDRKRELLLTLLDNLLLTTASASIVGLQMLGALVFQWCKASGSDGDLSLGCLCAIRMEKWHELSPPTLQQMFRLIVHDLPFNLATYSRQEKLSRVVFNRLWRVYNKWLEEGAEQETIDCVRKALICCRNSGTEVEDFCSLATSMLL